MVLDKYPKSTMWVAGDFNLPDIDWPTNTFSGNRYLNEINQTLLQILLFSDHTGQFYSIA
jgi:hypothetical protein